MSNKWQQLNSTNNTIKYKLFLKREFFLLGVKVKKKLIKKMSFIPGPVQLVWWAWPPGRRSVPTSSARSLSRCPEAALDKQYTASLPLYSAHPSKKHTQTITKQLHKSKITSDACSHWCLQHNYWKVYVSYYQIVHVIAFLL